MTRHHPHLPTLLTGAAALLLTLPAYADADAPPTLEPAATYLQQHPGGTKINPNEVRYGNLIVTVTPPTTAAAATATCEAGWFCFYTGINYQYPRGKLSSCGRQDLTPYGWNNRIDSVYYNLYNGRVTFYDNNTSSSNDDVALFTISTTTRGDPDTSPSRNKADYVYRYC